MNPDDDTWSEAIKFLAAVIAGAGLIALWCWLWVWWNSVGQSQ